LRPAKFNIAVDPTTAIILTPIVRAVAEFGGILLPGIYLKMSVE